MNPSTCRRVGVLQFSQRLAEMVKDGELTLALVPTRAFDELGATSLQALQAPFLLLGRRRHRLRVVTGPAEDLLSGLPATGYARDSRSGRLTLRHLFRHDHRPVLKLADFRGLQFATPTSGDPLICSRHSARNRSTSRPACRATSALWKRRCVRASTILGVTGSQTANITLYPKVYAVVANSDWFHRPTADQQRLLRERSGRDDDMGWSRTVSASEAVTAFCRTGQAVAVADPRDLAEIVAAAARFAGHGDRIR